MPVQRDGFVHLPVRGPARWHPGWAVRWRRRWRRRRRPRFGRIGADDCRDEAVRRWLARGNDFKVVEDRSWVAAAIDPLSLLGTPRATDRNRFVRSHPRHPSAVLCVVDAVSQTVLGAATDEGRWCRPRIRDPGVVHERPHRRRVPNDCRHKSAATLRGREGTGNRLVVLVDRGGITAALR